MSTDWQDTEDLFSSGWDDDDNEDEDEDASWVPMTDVGWHALQADQNVTDELQGGQDGGVTDG